MHHHMKKAMAVLAMAGLCTAAAANTATASFTMGQLRYELTDMNLDDGIAPALTFGSTEYYSQIWPASRDRVLSYQPGQFSASNWNGSATLTNTAASLGGTLVVSGNYVTVSAYQGRHFTLAPNTGVTFYADGEMNGSTGEVQSAGQTTIWGNVMLEGGRYRDNGPDGEWEVDRMDVIRPAGSKHDTLTISLRSYGDGMAGMVYLSGDMQSGVAAPPVPEPSGYAMLGAGLLALAVRRRFQSHA